MRDETDTVITAFADAVLEQDWEAAHACLAPWLEDAVEPDALAAMVEAARDDRPWPATYRVSGSSFTTPDSLREKWAQRGSAGGKGATAATGAPVQPIPDEVTMANHRRFAVMHFEPSDEDIAEHDVEVSFVVRVLVVADGRALRVGWLEVTH